MKIHNIETSVCYVIWSDWKRDFSLQWKVHTMT